MGVEPKSLDAAHGQEDIKKIAYIREDECIGCTKCIQACPVDAILGAAKQMHTVIVDECTGPVPRSGLQHPLKLLETSRYNSFSRRRRRAWL